MTRNQSYMQVFEQQTLRVGQTGATGRLDRATYERLAAAVEQLPKPYYRLVHRGVRFTQYVGCLQVGPTTIEILPKIDQAETESDHLGGWQAVLIEMLSVCRFFRVQSAGPSRVRTQPQPLLHHFWEDVLQRMAQALVQLPHRYQSETSNARHLKGRLDLPRHLRRNGAQPQRFLVEKQVFQPDARVVAVLRATSQTIGQLSTSDTLRQRAGHILRQLPTGARHSVTPMLLDQLLRRPALVPMRPLLERCRLILCGLSPDVRRGQRPLFSLLFDMNQLFERYVYERLRPLQSDDFRVERQTSVPFWEQRTLQPDLVVHFRGHRWVLDTKWKTADQRQPSVEDLRQLYLYAQYFDAPRGALLYPAASRNGSLRHVPFQPAAGVDRTPESYLLHLPVLLPNGELNAAIGTELFSFLKTNSRTL